MTARDDVSTPALVITDDVKLRETAVRWCATAGVTPNVTADPVAASAQWRHAPFIVVGQDCLAAMAQHHPSRRPDVHIICHNPEACWQLAVALGAERVVTTDNDELSETLAAAAEGSAEACVVAVLGGVGGAGASTFAAAVTLEAARRKMSALIIDLDHTGGGVDTLLGCEHHSGVRWPDMAETHGRLSGNSLQRVLVQHNGLSLLTTSRENVTPVPVAAAESVLRAALRAYDVVVADVPHALGPAAQAFLAGATATVLVVPEDIRSVGATRALLTQIDAEPSNPVLLSRARKSGIGSAETARLLGFPLLGRLGNDRRISAAVDHGEGPGRARKLRRASIRALDRLGLAQ